LGPMDMRKVKPYLIFIEGESKEPNEYAAWGFDSFDALRKVKGFGSASFTEWSADAEELDVRTFVERLIQESEISDYRKVLDFANGSLWVIRLK